MKPERDPLQGVGPDALRCASGVHELCRWLVGIRKGKNYCLTITKCWDKQNLPWNWIWLFPHCVRTRFVRDVRGRFCSVCVRTVPVRVAWRSRRAASVPDVPSTARSPVTRRSSHSPRYPAPSEHNNVDINAKQNHGYLKRNKTMNILKGPKPWICQWGENHEYRILRTTESWIS